MFTDASVTLGVWTLDQILFGCETVLFTNEEALSALLGYV